MNEWMNACLIVWNINDPAANCCNTHENNIRVSWVNRQTDSGSHKCYAALIRRQSPRGKLNPRPTEVTISITRPTGVTISITRPTGVVTNYIYNAPHWGEGAIHSPLLSPKLLDLFSKFKRRLTFLPKLSGEA